MGKQSKKKSKVNKQNRKAQEQQSNIVAASDSNVRKSHSQGRIDKWTILVGDRVWFDDNKSRDENNHYRYTYRGIVRNIQNNDSNNGVVSYSIQPLKNFFEENEGTWIVDESQVFRDVHNWTTRFDVGEQVVCATENGWIPATITNLWPVWEKKPDLNEVPSYKMTCLSLTSGLNNEPQEVAAPHDLDYCVRRHPSNFRFSANDMVSVDVWRAKHRVKNVPKSSSRFVPATVTKVDILGLEDFYAVYECEYETTILNQRITCWVLYDTDEYIAEMNANPRERLMDSIRQDCSYYHIFYLFQSSGIDALVIQDLIISKAIEFGCFAALRWLENDMGLELASLKFDNGNTILHQIAQSKSSYIFVKGFAQASFVKDSLGDFSLTSFCLNDRDYFWKRKNDSGETFVDLLLKTGDLRVLDCLFSPNNGLFWMFGKQLEKEDFYKCMEMTFHRFSPKGLLINTALEYMVMHSQSYSLHFIRTETEEDVLKQHFMKNLNGPHAVEAAKKLIRFVDQWEGHHPIAGHQTMSGILFRVASSGSYHIFRTAVEADPSLLKKIGFVMTSETRNEFVQDEMYPTDKRDYDYLQSNADISMSIVCGDAPSRPQYKSWENYLVFVQHSFLSIGTSGSLLKALLKQQEDRSDYELNDIIRYQIELLQDSASLRGRLQILDHLVTNSLIKTPSPLLPIRMRQCGVFRWLVENGHVRLGESALNHLTTPDARKLDFLGGQRVPAAVSSGTFLCFACVEYDSLFALQWLVNDNSVALDVQINGFNILHTCAYFGRLEIILWLRRRVQWSSLSSKASSRKGFEKQSALHIALSRGFTNAVELMISLDHPVPETKRLSLESLALKSPHEHVRSWGRQRSRHIGLSKDVGKLLTMLSNPGDYQGIKQFIHSTGCMTCQRWIDADVSRFAQPLPNGVSYQDVIMKCFKSIDDEFVLWMCHIASKNRLFRPLFRKIALGFEFWTGEMSMRTHLVGQYVGTSIEECLDYELVEYSRQPWVRKLPIDNVDDHPLISKGLLSSVLSQRFRQELLILWICDKLFRSIEREIFFRILSNASGAAISKLLSIRRELAEKSVEAEHAVHTIKDYHPEYKMFTLDGRVKLGWCLKSNNETYHYLETHPIRSYWPMRTTNFRNLPLCIVITIENYTQLIEWFYGNGEGWSPEKEITMARIASYLGHDDLANYLLSKAVYSSSDEIKQAILLGAGEAGREKVCRRILDDAQFCDVLGDFCLAEFSGSGYERSKNAMKETGGDWLGVKLDAETRVLSSSLPAMIVHGYLCRATGFRHLDHITTHLVRYLSILRTLAKEHGHSPFSFFEAAISVLDNSYQIEVFESATSLFEFLHEDLQLDFGERQYKSTLIKFLTNILERRLNSHCDTKDREIKMADDLLCAFERWGVDIQTVKLRSWFDKHPPTFLSELQEKQRARWAQFDLIKTGRPLGEICCAVESGSLAIDSIDRDGQQLVHLAAAYDRIDVLEWLVGQNESILEQRDREHRNALDSATVSKAQASTDWLQERRACKIISIFLKRHMRRKLVAAREAKFIFAIKRLQARQRGRQVRRAYRSRILSRVEGAERYRVIWETSMRILSLANAELSTWSLLRSNGENRTPQSIEMLESKAALEDSVVKAVNETVPDDVGTEATEDEEYAVDRFETNMTSLTTYTTIAEHALSCDLIHLSADVVKWFMRADGKFQKLFINKIERLRRGERSRSLAKALKGSVSVVYESYLEQKSGQRVLWQQEKDGAIFVWYVAKHKTVSRLVDLIDDCERRASRQRILASSLCDVDGPTAAVQGHGSDHAIRLDPLGNVPLKVYEVHSDKLYEMLDDGWVPMLYLSPEEREIVETYGTVLLLGRSGTGKTVCICNRISLDFWRFRSDPCFKQLFVARSRRLCRYVAENVDESGNIDFIVFLQLIRLLEEQLPVLGDKREVFLPTMKMGFARFIREVYGPSVTSKSAIRIDPLVVWTSIRTFLKGSIEALTDSDNSHLAKSSFMSLGKKRCRLSACDRESLYEIFIRYENFMKANRLWDDCDRIVSLLKRLSHAIQSDDPVMNDLRQSKIYVDEIQDYTQAEILLFFRLSGPGDLFLAGDPAQSVVEGVDFRFEEIRSVGYHVAGDRRDLIPQKPKTVTTNFRSHSGVLDVAAAILRRMFDAFPDSAKQLGEDRGVFNGPRPGVFQSVAVNRLKALVSEKLRGVTVLTHDSSVSQWKKVLDYELVYGVRAAKGLEFKSVIVLDFFVELPRSAQKPWRDLMLDRGRGATPELEGQLKLLYTAVTRCIERLFFAETKHSLAGDAFVRWLTTTSIRPTALATRQNIDDIEKMAMTQDEWVARGLDNAESAEMHAESNDFAEAQSLLETAIFCFEEGRDMVLARKARAYRTSLNFRANIQEGNGVNEAVEIRAAEILEQIGEENLLLEASRLLGDILPSLGDYTRERLEKVCSEQL